MNQRFYLSFLTLNQSKPDIVKQTAQIAKITDLSAAAFTTSPILNDATNCGKTTDKLKMPMYNPILVWSTFSLMMANGKDTTDAQPIPATAIIT